MKKGVCYALFRDYLTLISVAYYSQVIRHGTADIKFELILVSLNKFYSCKGLHHARKPEFSKFRGTEDLAFSLSCLI